MAEKVSEFPIPIVKVRNYGWKCDKVECEKCSSGQTVEEQLPAHIDMQEMVTSCMKLKQAHLEDEKVLAD